MRSLVMAATVGMATLTALCTTPQDSEASHWRYYRGYYGPSVSSYYYGPRWPAYSYSYGWGWPAYSYGYGWPSYSYSYRPPVYYSAPRAYYSPPVYYSSPVSTVTYYQPPVQSVRLAPTTRMVDVEAYADSFVPKTVHISTGTRVRWINYSGRTHTVTGSDGKWGSGDLLSGESYTVTFDRPGTYQYYCRHHEGMQGTIVVGSGSSARSDY